MIFKPKNSQNYHYEFQFEGRRIRRSTKQKNDRVARQMEAAAKTKLAKAEGGLEEKKEVPNFFDYAMDWLTVYAKTHCKFSTWKSYESVFTNHLNPAFGSKRLDEISRTHRADSNRFAGLVRWMNVAKTISQVTHDKWIGSINHLFRNSRKYRWRLNNPCLYRVGS